MDKAFKTREQFVRNEKESIERIVKYLKLSYILYWLFLMQDDFFIFLSFTRWNVLNDSF